MKFLFRDPDVMDRNQLRSYIEQLENALQYGIDESNCRRCDRKGYVNENGYCSSRCENGFVAPGANREDNLAI